MRGVRLLAPVRQQQHPVDPPVGAQQQVVADVEIDQVIQVGEALLVRLLRAEGDEVIAAAAHVQVERFVVMCDRHRSQAAGARRRPYQERAALFAGQERFRFGSVDVLVEPVGGAAIDPVIGP